MPNNVSSVEGEIWHSLTWLNQSKTFCINNLVNTHSIKECSIESLSRSIQLFRQRLSHKSVKAYATMPIGIMGRKSLALID